jgi:O-antigen ligase
LKQRIERAFFHWGWLTPALLPLAQVAGRAVFNIVGGVFVLWALCSLRGQKVELRRDIVLPYAVLLGAYLLSVGFAGDPIEGLDEWIKFLVYSANFIVVYAVLQLVPNGVERLISAFAAGALALIIVLYAMLAVRYGEPGFNPNLHMREDNLPFLMPFLLYGIAARNWGTRAARCVLIGVAYLSMVAYIILSEGRAALFAIVIALLACVWLLGGLRRPAAIAVVVLTLAAGVAGILSKFAPHLAEGAPLIERIDRVTSKRTALWRQALQSPPDNLLVGVGMGNLSDEPVLSVPLSNGSVSTVKHLHNFLFDAWYETGIIGLAALLFWLGMWLVQGYKVWRNGTAMLRMQAGVLLSGSLGIVAGALLSYSYLSKPFALYLPIFFAALAFLASPRPAAGHSIR